MSSRADASVDAVERVYREVYPRLWRALYAYAGDRDIATDAVAEAFAQVIRRGNRVRDAAGWVWVAAFRIAAGELDARRRFVPMDDAGMAEPGLDGVAVIQALRSLPSTQRAVLVLRYYCDYNTRESARILGMSSGAVRVHLTRGRRRLRAMLEE